MNCYPENIEDKIGFSAVRRLVAERCGSAMGRGKCEEMEFSADFAAVERRLRAVAEMAGVVGAADGFTLGGMHDIRERLAAIRPGGTHLGEEELLPVRSTLAAVVAVAAYFARPEASAWPVLSALASEIDPPAQAVRAIDAVILPTGEIRDNASPELGRIRRDISSAAAGISGAMRRVMARAVAEGVVGADTAPSMRDGRLVIPVSPADKRRIPGIVHDESATGKTFFIEPAEVVEANNRLRELQMEERREILRILTALADTLRPSLDVMLDGLEVLGEFDFIHAKAQLAMLTGGELPSLHPSPEMEWYGARHPILALSLEKQGKETVPLDISLSERERLLVVSGPNAGGKSVVLKTVAIVQYMAQCGVLPTLHANSHMGVFSSIMIDIGDDQSLENDLSTYSSHLRNMKHFLSHASPSTLILIDEFGSGTEPTLGGAIAQAMLGEFTASGTLGVVTTHFHNLKQFAAETPGLVNGSMLYDRQLLRPLFRLSIGTPGSSFALEIARKTGLPRSIVDKAAEIAGSDYVNLDKYLLDIARDKKYWENKRLSIRRREKETEETLERYRSEAEALRASRREILDQARREAEGIISGSNAAVERAISDIRRSQADREATLEARRRLSREKEQLASDSADTEPELLRRAPKEKKKRRRETSPAASALTPVAVGSAVLLDGAGQPGEVLEISGKNAVVAFGLLKTTVRLDRLTPTLRKVPSGAGKPSLVSASVSDSSRERQLNFRPEIDVRGMRVDEALQAVTYFIDDAVQFNAGRVRILHGTGTGALRASLRQYLLTVPQVEAAVDEDVRFGGAGITVVTLK